MLTRPIGVTVAIVVASFPLGFSGVALAESSSALRIGQASGTPGGVEAPAPTAPGVQPPGGVPTNPDSVNPSEAPTSPSTVPGATGAPTAPPATSPDAPAKPLPSSDTPTRADLNSALAEAVSDMPKQVKGVKTIDSSKLQSIRVVNVKTLLKEETEAEAFQKAMAKNGSETKALQEALNKNELIRKTLTDNNIPIARIVAVNVADPVNLLIFYQ
jgi:hypothetical protein